MLKEPFLSCDKCGIEFPHAYDPDANCYYKVDVHPSCETCEKRFCSEECAQIEATEDTFPGSCPGVYWCGLCKEGYLAESKNHRFNIARHDPHPDLKTYLDLNPEDWSFVEQCLTCGMWCYEYRSHTDTPGKYQDQPCGTKIRSSRLDRE